MGRRLVLFVSGFVACAFGIGCFSGIENVTRVFLFCSAMLFVLATMLLVFRKKYISLPLFGMAVCVIFVYVYAALFYAPAQKLVNDNSATFEGIAVTRAVKSYSSTYFTIKSDDGIKAVVYSYDNPEIELGDRLKITGKLYLSDSSYSISKGVYIRITAKSMEKLPGEGLPWYLYPTYANYALSDAARGLYPDEVSAFVTAIITGNKDYMSNDFKDMLINTGLYHTVAVSGMHVSFIMSFLLLILPFSKRKSSLIVIFTIFGFMALTGFTPSIVRAGIIGIMALGAPYLRRDYDPITGIAASALIILIANPFSVLDYGFVLSYTSFIGIILFSTPIKAKADSFFQNTNPYLRKTLGYFSSVMAATLSSLILSLPVLVFLFEQVSLVSVIANMLCIWAVTAIFIAGFCSVAAFLIFPPLGKLIGYSVIALYKYIAEVSGLLNKLPYANIGITGYVTPLFITFVYLAIAALYIFNKHRRKTDSDSDRLIIRIPVYIFAVVTTLSLCFMLSAFDRANSLKVTALNVGQGQCVVATSGGVCAVFDCGGSTGQKAADTAIKYIKRQNHTDIDLLVISHFDKDHTNGVEDLFGKIKIKTIALPDIEDKTAEEIKQLAKAHKAEVVLVSEDYASDFCNASLILFGDMVNLGANDNDKSLVGMLSFGEFDFLITGDLQKAGENRLIKLKTLPDAEVIVAGHHGSKNSTTEALIDRITPEYVFISCGTNYYGHPAEELLKRLDDRDIRYYVTRFDGSLTAVARKKGYEVYMQR